MSEMVERLEAAILRYLQKDENDYLSEPFTSSIDTDDENGDPIYVETDDVRIFDGGIVLKDLARVVIEEIRIPTEAMIEAGITAEVPGLREQVAPWKLTPHDRVRLKAEYQAMIGAMLKD